MIFVFAYRMSVFVLDHTLGFGGSVLNILSSSAYRVGLQYMRVDVAVV